MAIKESIDFEGLSQCLLSRVREILPEWLPGGRVVGHEYTCGSIQGGLGDSCKVNLNTGKWADFASTEKGSDLISLYAAIEGVSQIESATKLLGEFDSVIPSLNPSKVKEVKIIPPPVNAVPPDMRHFKYGDPVASWCYKDLNSKPMFFVARYDTPEGKQFLPWTWSSEGRWICKAWPKPRILYGLPDLKARPERPVLIVEGEKCADVAKAIVGNRYVVVTWPNGAKAVHKADWRVLSGRNILIWPDADESGRNAAKQIANILSITCPQIKIINTEGRPEGWDVADSGFSWEEFEKIVNACPKWHENKNSFPGDSINELKKKYGCLYYLNDNGEVNKVNESFWAGLHFAEHIELFEPEEKCFYRYDPKSGLYEPTSEDIIKQEISERILEVSRQDNQPSLEKKRENTTLNSIIGQLRGIAERRGCFAKKVKTFVHLANGVITLSDEGRFDLVNFSPDFYSRNQSPIVYDPNARCDRFLNELLMPAVNSGDALLIQKYMGMSLLGDNLIQRFLILDGLGGRGKTQLALVVQNLIGLINVIQLRTNLLNERFELYRFRKKSLLVGVDVPGTFLSEKSAQVIKGLVGGDMFSPEKKNNIEDFQIKGNYCTVITSNARLHIKLDGDHSAWERRLLIVRYEAPPPAKKIPNFAELLIKDEGSGILNFALEGLKLLLEDVKNIGDIALAEKQASRIDALLAESDSLRHFLRENVVRDEKLDLTIQEIIEAYAEYCPAMGWVAKPITTIQRELEGLMLELFRTSKANSIKRNDKNGKGFRYVNFKKGVSEIILEEEE